MGESITVEWKEDLERQMLDIVYQYTRQTQKDGPKAGDRAVSLEQLKQRTLDREKVKYEQTPIYKQITKSLTYRNEVFEENIEAALDPKHSPLQPAMYVNQKLEKERLKIEVEQDRGKDPYTTKLPEVDKYARPVPTIPHMNTLRKINPTIDKLRA